MHLFHGIFVSHGIGSCSRSRGCLASLLFPVTQPKIHYRTQQSSQAGCPPGKPLDNILQGQSNGSAIVPACRQGTVKLMAVTDGSVVPSSRARTMRELLHPALLPGVTAHPAEPRTRGKEQTCQFVTHPSSGPARLIGRGGGTCAVLVAP